MTTLYIDVSHHDWDRRGGALDWASIAGAGMGRVMCARASYGDPQVFNPPSPRFAEYMAAGRAAGFDCRGGYHNLIRGDQASINRQVDLLRSTMDRYGAEWAMADVEAYAELVQRGLVPGWQDVQRFHDRWYAVESRTMAWYIARWVWEGHLGSPDLTGLRGPLINANYRGGDGTAQGIYANAGTAGWAEYLTAPKGGPVRRSGRSPDIWQFTSTGNVPGASDSTDVNAYPGTVDQLVAMLTGTHNEGDDDMPRYYRILDGEVGVSNGPVRYGFATPADVDVSLAAHGKTWADIQTITPADLAGTGWGVSLNALVATVAAIASKVDIDPAELEAIKQAAGAGVAAQIPALVDALVARLPADSMSREDLAGVLRDVLAPGFVLGSKPTS